MQLHCCCCSSSSNSSKQQQQQHRGIHTYIRYHAYIYIYIGLSICRLCLSPLPPLPLSRALYPAWCWCWCAYSSSRGAAAVHTNIICTCLEFEIERNATQQFIECTYRMFFVSRKIGALLANFNTHYVLCVYAVQKYLGSMSAVMLSLTYLTDLRRIRISPLC